MCKQKEFVKKKNRMISGAEIIKMVIKPGLLSKDRLLVYRMF